MPHILEDRVLEITTTTGTGDITLTGAVTGFRRFNAVCAVGDTAPYYIEGLDSVGQPNGEYEYGTGTYSAADTLTRTTVLGSSNAGAAVNFSAGNKNVGIALNKSELASQIATAQAAAIASSTFAGELRISARKTPPAGRWLKCNSQTIGSAASGATARANADVQELYEVLWTDWDNTVLPIQTSAGAATVRGASAAADFAANKRMPLPEIRGEFPRFWDDGRGVDAGRAMGSAQSDQVKDHTHSLPVGPAGNGAGAFTNYWQGTGPSSGQTTGNMTTGGSTETRPRNVAWQGFIRY